MVLKQKYVCVGSIITAVLILDQFTKYLVVTYIRMFDTISIVPGFFNLTHVRNRGAAFGIFSSFPGFVRSVFFVLVTLIAVAVIAVVIKKTVDRVQVWAFSLIAGGALGNLIDRIRYNEVVDFIDWYIRSYHWPSFNIADSAISIGVGLLIVDMLFLKKHHADAVSGNNT